ncbi:MAG: hypothetical protein ACI8X5_004157 [Planctomycetota bacterium]|jgi:hypothetical protein
MMIHLYRLLMLLGLALGLALSACSSIDVNADYDMEMDFTPLHTYSWLSEGAGEESDEPAISPLVSNRVIAAVDAELQAGGYRLVDAQSDFLVGFRISVHHGVDVHQEPSYYGRYGRYGRHGGYGMAVGSTTHVYEYEEGTLEIDFLDGAGKALIWRGTGAARLRDNQTPEESTARINEVVAKVLAQFPPS